MTSFGARADAYPQADGRLRARLSLCSVVRFHVGYRGHTGRLRAGRAASAVDRSGRRAGLRVQALSAQGSDRLERPLRRSQSWPNDPRLRRQGEAHPKASPRPQPDNRHDLPAQGCVPVSLQCERTRSARHEGQVHGWQGGGAARTGGASDNGLGIRLAGANRNLRPAAPRDLAPGRRRGDRPSNARLSICGVA